MNMTINILQLWKSNVKSNLLGFQVSSAKLRNFHAPRTQALLPGTKSSCSYLNTMLLNIKLPRIFRVRPVLVKIITAKFTFSVQTQNREETN